ncbi:hypothetical protein ABPG75_006492 [Micractinium tetrahymenae]
MERRSLLAAFFALLAALLVCWPSTKRGDSETACPLGYGGSGGGGGSNELPFPHGFAALNPKGSSKAQLKPPPKLLLYWNATVWTGEPPCEGGEQAAPQGAGAAACAPTHAEAFVVDASAGRFLFVGSAEEARRAAAAAAAGGGGGGSSREGHSAGAGSGTASLSSLEEQHPAYEAVDLQGAHVTPGLIDAHLHLIPGGLSLSRLDLSAATSRQQFVSAVAAAAAGLSDGSWLLGAGWDESKWGGELPSAAWVDAVTPSTPFLLTRHDAHMALANSAALRLAGIGPGTSEPPGGTILKAADGQPSGLLTDAAIQLVSVHIPPLSVSERRRAFEAAVQHALSLGITMVHDLSRIAFLEGEEAAWEDLEEVYVPAANEGRLPLRIHSFVPLTTWRRMAERVRHLGTAHPSGMLFWGGVKEFADGSLGSRTALFHQPYADQPGSSGTRTIELAALRRLVADADAAGLQVAVHAIGDRAVDEVLSIYAELAANRSVHSSGSSSAHGNGSGGDGGSGSSSRGSSSSGGGATEPGRRRPPHRIEHAQHISGPATAAAMATAGVAATPNPQHLLADRAVLLPRLGAERAGAGRTYAFRTLLQAGVVSAFGSDWPVVPLDPLAGALYAAVHRAAPGSGDAPWAPSEALTPAQALAAHTWAGAAAAGFERDLGSIAAGKLADFAVLSRQPGDTAARARQTHVGGRCQFGPQTSALPPSAVAWQFAPVVYHHPLEKYHLIDPLEWYNASELYLQDLRPTNESIFAWFTRNEIDEVMFQPRFRTVLNSSRLSRERQQAVIYVGGRELGPIGSGTASLAAAAAPARRAPAACLRSKQTRMGIQQ